MAAFSYSALNEKGKTVKGIIEGDSERQVRSQLRAKNLKPLAVEGAGNSKVSQSGSEKSAGAFAGLFQKRIKLKGRDLSLITRQLASLIKSGLPLDEALKATAKQNKNPNVKEIVLQVRAKVLEGLGLAQALGEFPWVFDEMYRAMVRAGENTGHLGPVLERLAEYTLNAQVVKSRIKSAMTYPLVLLGFSFCIIAALMVFIVPDLVKVFAQGDRELPIITRALIASSDFLVNYGLFCLIVIVGIIVGIRKWLEKPGPKLRWHAYQLRLPVVGELINQANSARFASTLSLLMSSGVPLLQALRIAGQVMSNKLLQKACEQVANQVHEGTSLYRAMENADCFPPLLVQMIASGETNGTLPEQLEHAARDQERELEMIIAVSLGLMEPAAIIFMAVAVCLIVLAILMPILEMNQMV